MTIDTQAAPIPAPAAGRRRKPATPSPLSPDAIRLGAIITAASEHLSAFAGRVLPTISTPANSKLPMLRGGCRSAKANVGDLVGLFSQSDAYDRGLSATGYAYYPARDIVVIDRDEKNGKSGRADTDHVAQQIGCPLPETATVRTPSGGDHLYFRLPLDTVLPKSLIGIIGRRPLDADGKPMLSGVDIFAYAADKSYWVAGPGTVTPKGEYVWANDLEPAMLPQAWIEHIKAAKPPKTPRDPSQPRPERETITLGFVKAALNALDPATVLHEGHSRPHDTRHMIRAIIMEALVIDGAGDEFLEEDKIELLREWTDRNPRNIPDDFDRKMTLLLESLEDDTVGRATVGSLYVLAKANGYIGPAPSAALANAKARGLFTPTSPVTTDEPPVLSTQAPMDSAEEMLRREFTHDGKLTLVRDRGEFHLWGGRRYTTVAPERLEARIGAFLRGAYQKKDDSVVPFSSVSKNVEEVRKALVALTHAPEGAKAPCWLDGRNGPDPQHLLAVSNGLLNLTTREVLPHTPAYFCPNALDFAYDAAAKTPEWDNFLSQLWPDDRQSIDTLQEMFGLMLTGDTSHHKAFLIKGPPRSGKGTIGHVLTALLGRDNICTPTLAALGKDFGKQSLIGKRLALISDAQLGGRADPNAIAETLLSITGEDTVNIGRKYQIDWIGRLEARFVIMTNELPRITNASGALASRFILLTMTQSFLGREDHGLTDRLLRELPGVLNWALEGLARLRQRGRLVQPRSSTDELQEMEHLGSPIKAFLHEECDVGADFTVDRKDIYGRFIVWCLGEGIVKPVDVREFGKQLGAAVQVRTTKVGSRGDQARRYQGVGLKGSTETSVNATVVALDSRRQRPSAPPMPAPVTADSIVVATAPNVAPGVRTVSQARLEARAARSAASVQGSGAVH